MTPGPNVTVEVNGDATMTCNTVGTPTPMVTWSFRGNDDDLGQFALR